MMQRRSNLSQVELQYFLRKQNCNKIEPLPLTKVNHLIPVLCQRILQHSSSSSPNIKYPQQPLTFLDARNNSSEISLQPLNYFYAQVAKKQAPWPTSHTNDVVNLHKLAEPEKNRHLSQLVALQCASVPKFHRKMGIIMLDCFAFFCLVSVFIRAASRFNLVIFNPIKKTLTIEKATSEERSQVLPAVVVWVDELANLSMSSVKQTIS